MTENPLRHPGRPLRQTRRYRPRAEVPDLFEDALGPQLERSEWLSLHLQRSEKFGLQYGQHRGHSTMGHHPGGFAGG